METIYSCDSNKKAELDKILTNDPYGTPSFSRHGYDLQEGSNYGLENKWILYIKGNQEFIDWAEPKIKDVTEKLDQSKTEEIVKKMQAKKDQAAGAFGDIFG